MSSLVRLLWKFWGQQRLVREVKRRSVVFYLRVVRGTRSTVMTVFLIFLVLQTMMLSAFGALVTGMLLWDHDFAAKMEILFWTFVGLFSIPAVLLVILMSEFLWFRVTGAKRLINSLDN